MLLKPGDKVSFLNEKRDGIVQKILNNKMVLVEIEEGFTIPVLEHDLVRAQNFEENEAASETPLNFEEEKVEVTEERFSKRKELLKLSDNDSKIKHGLFIAFVPEYPDKILSSGIGIYLINHNEFDTLFIYGIKVDDKYVCKDFDNLNEESAILLDLIDVSDVDKWKEIQFQFLFFKQNIALNKPPEVHELFIRPVRFYKEENYKICPLLNEKCFLFSLTDKDEKQPEVWVEEKWENTKVEKLAGVKVVGHINDFFKVEPFPEKHIIGKGVAEVDLHINELMENYSDMDSFEIMTMQLNYFSKMIELAICNKLRKIIFIHGVGDGRLKQEIINRLIKDYSFLKYHDAPLIRYGFGATEVVLIDTV